MISAHPRHTMRAWVANEVRRIFASNTYEHLAWADVRRFFQRLKARGYPPYLLSAALRHRQRPSQRPTNREPTTRTPLFFVLTYHPRSGRQMVRALMPMLSPRHIRIAWRLRRSARSVF